MRILQADERNKISRARAETRDSKQYIKYTSLLMFDDGLTYQEIAHHLGIGTKTPQRAVRAYRAGGLEALNKAEYVGRAARLTEEQEKILVSELKINLYISCKEIQAYIRKEFKVSLSISGVCRLLRRLGFVYKKPKVVPGKADRQQQEASAKEIKEIIGQISEDEVAYFIDGVHPTHNAGDCYGWIMKGEEYELPTNSGRKRLNINGAMNAQHPEDVVTDFTESVNAQSTQRLMEKLMKQNSKKKRIYIISDNALYYKNKALTAWLAKHSVIKWIYLPPYSPNLNLIERLWRMMRNKVINGFYYPDFKEFKEEIQKFLNNLGDLKSELKSLMTLNFHLYGQVN